MSKRELDIAPRVSGKHRWTIATDAINCVFGIASGTPSRPNHDGVPPTATTSSSPSNSRQRPLSLQIRPQFISFDVFLSLHPPSALRVPGFLRSLARRSRVHGLRSSVFPLPLEPFGSLILPLQAAHCERRRTRSFLLITR